MALVTKASRERIKGRTVKVLHAFPHGVYVEDVDTGQKFVIDAMQGVMDEPWLVIEEVDDRE